MQYGCLEFESNVFCLFCTRLLFSSFGRHWYKVALYQMQPAQVFAKPSPGCSSDSLVGHRTVTFVRYRTVKSCPVAQKRSTCESHVNESQRLRMFDHHLSRMTRTHANWVEIALYGKGQTEPNAAAQVSLAMCWMVGQIVALDSLFLGHFGSNDC